MKFKALQKEIDHDGIPTPQKQTNVTPCDSRPLHQSSYTSILVTYASRWVSLEHLLLSRYESMVDAKKQRPRMCTRRLRVSPGCILSFSLSLSPSLSLSHSFFLPFSLSLARSVSISLSLPLPLPRSLSLCLSLSLFLSLSFSPLHPQLEIPGSPTISWRSHPVDPSSTSRPLAELDSRQSLE